MRTLLKSEIESVSVQGGAVVETILSNALTSLVFKPFEDIHKKKFEEHLDLQPWWKGAAPAEKMLLTGGSIVVLSLIIEGSKQFLFGK